tara:strand:+ start:12693 stop:13151 length:459 start_codon:yes stop_codon:yes gene_type:complete
MRKITEFAEGHDLATDAELVLPYDTRKKSRFRAELKNGEPLGVILPRGRVLRGGDYLQDEAGKVIGVVAAPESVSLATSDNACLLVRAAYHLGNRHVPLQVGDGWLRYQHDHVLDDMVLGLGLRVAYEQAPFEPEDGAYASTAGGGQHGHSH